MVKSNERVIEKILKTSSKDKKIFITFEGKWYRATACKSKSRAGVRYAAFMRIIKVTKNAL